MIFSKKYPVSVQRKISKIAFAILFFVVSGCFPSSAQIEPAQIQEYLSKISDAKPDGMARQNEINEFYSLMNYRPAWINRENNQDLNILLQQLSSADIWGLRQKDYQYSFISSFRNDLNFLKTWQDSVRAEILLTDAAIHFYSEIAYGNTAPSLNYTGIKYNPACRNVQALLAQSILKNELNFFPSYISASLPEVNALQNKIRQISEVMKKENFKESVIVSKKINTENQALCTKLYQLGLINIDTETISEKTLKQKVKEAELMFNLPVKGALEADLVRELNVPLKVRLDQLVLSLNYYRWLYCLTQTQQVIVVNIPAAYLKVYKNEKVILEMMMIVGKPTTPTIPLASIVNEVIIYPYWYVPNSIATKELLPLIKKNPGFLDANNYQVLNKAGRIVNPYSVDWHSLSRNNFPYTIRQGTGCDNSLGLLKLNFYNPFGAYLHDTPNKELFKQPRRFYSHGCMRMEKPIELGHLVLKNNQIAIDTITEKGCLKNQAPIIVPADVKMPVIVWYNPTGIDSAGRVLFFEDPYRKFNRSN